MDSKEGRTYTTHTIEIETPKDGGRDRAAFGESVIAAAELALEDHPLVRVLGTMNRKQRLAFKSAMRRTKRSQGLEPCFAAARAAGWIQR